MNASSLVRSKDTSKTSSIVTASRGKRSPLLLAAAMTSKRMPLAAASVTPRMKMLGFLGAIVAVAVTQRAMPPSVITHVMQGGFMSRSPSQYKTLMLVSGHTWNASASLPLRQ